MATGVMFHQFPEDLAHGVHDFSADALTAFLTNTAISASADATLADITSPVTTNLSSRVFGTPTTDAQSTGLYTLLLPDLVLTASGTVADFRYVGVYNDTPTSPADPLICGWDYGSTVSMVATNTFTFDFTTYTVRI